MPTRPTTIKLKSPRLPRLPRSVVVNKHTTKASNKHITTCVVSMTWGRHRADFYVIFLYFISFHFIFPLNREERERNVCWSIKPVNSVLCTLCICVLCCRRNMVRDIEVKSNANANAFIYAFIFFNYCNFSCGINIFVFFIFSPALHLYRYFPTNSHNLRWLGRVDRCRHNHHHHFV